MQYSVGLGLGESIWQGHKDWILDPLLFANNKIRQYKGSLNNTWLSIDYVKELYVKITRKEV